MLSIGRGGPLYSSAWTPTPVGGYAGTCVFLFALGVVLRCLLAAKSILELCWIDVDLQRRYVVKTFSEERVGDDSRSTESALTETGLERDGLLVRRVIESRPRTIVVDATRATIDTLIVGVLYLT